MAAAGICDVCGGPIPRSRTGGRPKRCSPKCRLAHQRAYERRRYAENPDQGVARTQAYQRRNPERYLAQVQSRPPKDPIKARASQLRNRYGLTLDQYDAMAEAQGGRCAICKRLETRRARGRPLPLSVDHDHETGAVRGLLCARCNAVLGFFDDPDLFAAATGYLSGRRLRLLKGG